MNGTITITGRGGDKAAMKQMKEIKGTIFKNCAPFSDCISEMSNS